jgi:hypothetical protein
VTFILRERTLGILTRAMATAFSQGELGTLFMEVEARPWIGRADVSREKRARWLLQALHDDGRPEAEKVALDLLQRVLAKGGSGWGTPEWMSELENAIEADGLEWDSEEGRLVPTVPGLALPAEASALERLLVDKGLPIAAGHYRQAVESFSDGNWAAANGQLRSSIEATLPEIAQQLTGKQIGNVPSAVDALRAAGHLVKGEEEFAKGLWALSHASGSHPGLSDQEDSRFRLLAVTGYLRYAVERLL